MGWIAQEGVGVTTTLDALVDALPLDLVPTSALPRPARELTGVHISELLDPTPFLSGGELLLTTGLGLPTQTTPLTGYVTRLIGAGVAALGFGVGVTHERLPDGLRTAAHRAGLPLLVVPAQTPFQAIVKQFFAGQRREESRDLTGALGAVHALVRAATHGEPGRDQARRQVIRVLAGAVEGWAAHIDAAGQPVAVWPRSAAATARQAGAEVARIRATGALAGATFPVGPDDVLLQPVGGADGGYVACGRARPTPTQLRHLTLAACAVLELAARRMTDDTLLRAAAPVVAGQLLSLGLGEAAQAYARSVGRPWPDLVRVGCTVRSGPVPEPSPAVEPSPAIELARHGDDGRVTSVWSCDEASAAWAHLTHHAAASAPSTGRDAGTGVAGPDRGVLGAAVPPGAVATEWRRVTAQAQALPAGRWLDAADAGGVGDEAGAADRALVALAGYPGVDLVATLAAYLAERGRIEGTSVALGLHRNTIRHRLGLIARTAELDVDDPDTAAHLWLALRRAGLAPAPQHPTASQR